MRRNVMIILLAACGLFAIYPAVVWLAARLINAIDDRWLTTIGLTSFTVPMSLALAAVILAVHGLLVNADIQAEAVDEFEQFREREAEMAAVAARELAPAASGIDAPDGASISASRERSNRSQRTPPEEQSKGQKLKKRASRMGRRHMRQSFRWFR